MKNLVVTLLCCLGYVSLNAQISQDDDVASSIFDEQVIGKIRQFENNAESTIESIISIEKQKERVMSKVRHYTYNTNSLATSKKVVGIQSGSRKDDSLVLVALYKATGGTNWFRKDSWLTSASLDQWQGVELNFEGRVSVLQLDYNNLSGQILKELSNLSSLEELWLTGNNLSGSIPKELGNLSNLKSLWLGVSNLSGSIPKELGNLANLESLFLGFSGLSGSIPKELSNLSKLSSLDLYYNQLSGSIPKELSNLNNLTYLNLSNNQLTGSIPPELGNLSSLRFLEVGDNQLSGSIPKELSNLAKLERLILRRNNLSGQIPDDITRLQNLNYMSLSSNKLTGSIPKDIGSLSNLEYLALSQNLLTGEIPPSLWKLKKANSLILWGNPFVGSIPSEIVDFKHLKNFQLSFKEYNGSLPEAIWNLDSMQILAIQMRPFDGIKGKIINSKPISISEKIQNWKDIENIIIEGSSDVDTSSVFLKGEIPSEIFQCKKLRGLYLSGNALTGIVNNNIELADSLETLGLAFNKLKGNISTAIGKQSNLKGISLRNNLLSGLIPKEIGNLKKLKGLYISDCRLDGGLENIPNHALDSIWAYGNRFDFADFAKANINAITFRYSPQDSLGIIDTLQLNSGAKVTIGSATEHVEGNVYRWFKNNQLLPNEVNKELIIDVVKNEDSGDYSCEVSNTLAPELTLYRRPATVKVLNPSSINEFSGNSGILVFPNPISDNLRITSPVDVAVNLYDVLGNCMISLKSTSTETVINTTGLTKGVYNVSIETDYGKSFHTLIKN